MSDCHTVFHSLQLLNQHSLFFSSRLCLNQLNIQQNSKKDRGGRGWETEWKKGSMCGIKGAWTKRPHLSFRFRREALVWHQHGWVFVSCCHEGITIYCFFFLQAVFQSVSHQHFVFNEHINMCLVFECLQSRLWDRNLLFVPFPVKSGSIWVGERSIGDRGVFVSTSHAAFPFFECCI